MDLTFQMAETSQGLVCMAEYNSDLFEAETVDRLLVHYEILLKAATTTPETPIACLPLLSESEIHQQALWNRPQKTLPSPQTLSSFVEQWIERTPDAVAVRCRGESLTYRELGASANQLARVLQERGVGPEIPVGVFVRRSLDMIVALLGVMKAGGAYVPLDPVYPIDRIASILEDTQAPVLLTQSTLLEQLPAFSGEILCLDRRRACRRRATCCWRG